MPFRGQNRDSLGFRAHDPYFPFAQHDGENKMSIIVYETYGMDTVDHRLPNMDIALDYMMKKSKLAQIMGWQVKFTVWKEDEDGQLSLIRPEVVMQLAKERVARQEREKVSN